MKGSLLIIGLDCLGAELLAPETLDFLPHLRRLRERGIAGPLESTLPPITIPAWTSMLTGRDPGELGIYGFRNRKSYGYGDLVYATSAHVRFPRIWDYVGHAGGRSVVVGVPQTAPPPRILGDLVQGFQGWGKGGAAGEDYTSPRELAQELERACGEYIFDVDDFRNVPREVVVERIYRMTERRFQWTEHLLATRRWDFAMHCEIGPDRLHHCFWSDHDPTHPRHDPRSAHRETIWRYYRYLDERVGRLIERVGGETAILVASDHGAQAMHGGVCINEVLQELGWLRLKEQPDRPGPLTPERVDWSQTRAWGDGGYYARIFLNLQGRESEGVIAADRRDEARRELTAQLRMLTLHGGPTLTNDVVWPERAYRRVRGLAPDLLVFFDGLSWRSIGSVGHGRTWIVGNDTGLDEANHARDGLYILAGPGIHPGGPRRASIMDITPTVLQWFGIAPPADLRGQNLFMEP